MFRLDVFANIRHPIPTGCGEVVVRVLEIAYVRNDAARRRDRIEGVWIKVRADPARLRWLNRRRGRFPTLCRLGTHAPQPAITRRISTMGQGSEAGTQGLQRIGSNHRHLAVVITFAINPSPHCRRKLQEGKCERTDRGHEQHKQNKRKPGQETNLRQSLSSFSHQRAARSSARCASSRRSPRALWFCPA